LWVDTRRNSKSKNINPNFIRFTILYLVTKIKQTTVKRGKIAMNVPLNDKSHEVQPLKTFEVENMKAAVKAMNGLRDTVFTSIKTDKTPSIPKNCEHNNNTRSISKLDTCSKLDNMTRPPVQTENG